MAQSDIGGRSQWKPWRVGVTADDTLLTAYEPADFPTIPSLGGTQATFDTFVAKLAIVDPFSAIGIRAWGKDTDNDTATITISGWMDPFSKNGTGPGQRLWEGQIVLGSHTYSGSIILGGSIDTADATWFEVDTYNPTVSGGFDAVDAVERQGGNHSMLLFPTLGYTHLLLEISDVGSASEMTEVAVLWRGISREGVV